MVKAFLEEMVKAKADFTDFEKEYAEKLGVALENVKVGTIELASRFSDAYIVRSHKETEEIIAEADVEFFRQPLSYLKKHKEEYIYVESKWFDALGVDAVSLELDDLFKTYGVMVGLKQKKNTGSVIKSFLETELEGDSLKYAAMFNGDEGIWDINFSLNYVNNFSEELTIGEAYLMIHQLLFKLVFTLEDK